MIKNSTHLGKVCGWNKERKFGFVRSMNDGGSYFLHRSKVGQDVSDGTIIEFEVFHEEDKVYAANVTVVEMPE